MRLDKQAYNYYKGFKEQKNEVFCKLLKPLAKFGISGDFVSILGLFTGIIAAISIHFSHAGFLLFWFMTRIADVLDGVFARLNKQQIFKNINLDYFCDNLFSVLLFITVIPFVGLTLPIIATITFVIHVITDMSLKGETALAPRSDYAQALFLFGLFEEGLILQIVITLINWILSRIVSDRGD
jgi:phosphatidylserine synthase